MLRLIESGFSRAGKELYKEEIRARTEEKLDSYLIVPEQQTVSAEGEMVDFLPENAPLYFEATNFTRLADTVFRKIGGVCAPKADKSKRALIMWRALTELSPMLDMTRASGEVGAGTVERALSAIGELQAHGAAPDDIRALSESESLQPRLKSKLSDISLIYALYKKLLHEKYIDADDGLCALARGIGANAEIFAGAHIYIDGFTSFTEGEYRVIGELMRICEVTVLLPLPSYDRHAFEFCEVLDTRGKLLKLASEKNVPVKLEKCEKALHDRAPILTEAVKLLWHSTGEIDNEYLQNTDNLRIFEAYTPFEECDFIASDIKRRIMSEGAKFSDFAIVLSDERAYDGILDLALSKYGVPYFASAPEDLERFEAVKLIYSAYSAISAFRREDVISYAKCGFCGISRDECDEFELYCEAWGIFGSRFYDGSIWNMHPDGYGIPSTPESDEKLIRINRTKETVISPLVRLKSRVSGTHTVLEHAKALYDFMCELGTCEALTERAMRLKELGQSELAEENLSLYKVICQTLDSLTDAIGELSVERETFLNQLKVAFSGAKVGRIPGFIDEVTVGSAQMLRLNGKKHIYMPGVSYGEFPRNPKDDSFFSERDKSVMSALGLSLEPDLEIKSAKELFYFSRAMSFAEESVTITYPNTSSDFKAKAPADVIERLSVISGGKIKPRKISELSPLDKIYTTESALLAYGEIRGEEREVLSSALSECGVTPRTLGEGGITNDGLKLGREASDMLYPTEMTLSQSRIDRYNACPLNYYCTYDLKLKNTEPYEIDSREIGNMIHAVLETFFTEAEREGVDFKTVSDGEIADMTMRSASRHIIDMATPYELQGVAQLSLKKLYKLALPVISDLCRELRGCEFKPKFLELNISRAGEKTPNPPIIKGEDAGCRIVGKIDRVDLYKKDDKLYVRVIDYKTGSKSFSPSDIEKGENLQMFLYLKSILDTKKPEFLKAMGADSDTEIIPAGVIYIKTGLTDKAVEHDSESEVSEAIRHSQSRQGMLLLDDESLSAQNPEYLPIKRNKDGSVSASSKKYLYDAEGWDSLMQTIEGVVSDTATRMKSGDISTCKKSGAKNPCEYCDYRAFCRKA